jgi:hypothetical protein
VRLPESDRALARIRGLVGATPAAHTCRCRELATFHRSPGAMNIARENGRASVDRRVHQAAATWAAW